MRKEKLIELTFSELNKINGGGFWKDVGKYFLVSQHGFIEEYSQGASNPMVLMEEHNK